MRIKTPIRSMLFSYMLILSMLLLLSAAGNWAIKEVTGNLPIEVNNCIIIDAGHGGVDGGATSCTGVLESRINLEIALRLNDVMQLLGMKTKMIRSEDVSIHTEEGSIATKKVSDLKNRVALVNKTENAILISIHQNHFTDGRYRGAQVFYPAEPASKMFAQKMQQAFVDTLNTGSKRRAKLADGIYLMDKIKQTGILIECGFLSNPDEEALLRSSDYQKKLCMVIAATTSRYLYHDAVA